VLLNLERKRFLGPRRHRLLLLSGEAVAQEFVLDWEEESLKNFELSPVVVSGAYR
jgi:hypothetical protein